MLRPARSRKRRSYFPSRKLSKYSLGVFALLLRQALAAQGIGAAVLDLGGGLLDLGLGLVLQVRAAGQAGDLGRSLADGLRHAGVEERAVGLASGRAPSPRPLPKPLPGLPSLSSPCRRPASHPLALALTLLAALAAALVAVHLPPGVGQLLHGAVQRLASRSAAGPSPASAAGLPAWPARPGRFALLHLIATLA